MVFAKGDRAFFLTNGTTFKEIETLETIGWRSTEYRYAMMVNNNLPVVDRIVSAFRLVEKYSGAKLFPIMIWDTKSGKSAIIEEEGKKMSVIIGCVREECVWMATDTQRTWGNTVTHAKSEFASNILWMPNGVMVGIAGNQAVKHAVAVHEEWFENLSNQPLTKKYIVEEIIPSLYKAMEEINEIDERSAKSGRTLFNGMILLAQQNRLYCIDSDFAVVSIADYCLIGHGSEYGVPRMEQYDTTLSDDETMELLEKALKDAEKFSKMTSAPFQMSDTLSRKIVEIGEHKK